MDVSLIGLIVMVAMTLALSRRFHGRVAFGPGYEYQRVFSVAALGTLLLGGGLIGLDVTHRGGFDGSRWLDGPVWWEVGSGLLLLALAGLLAYLVPPHDGSPTRQAARRRAG